MTIYYHNNRQILSGYYQGKFSQILWFLLLLFVSLCRYSFFDQHDGTNAGGNSNAGRTGRGGGQRIRILLFFCYCFSTFMFSSFHSSYFPIISFLTSATAGGARKESTGRMIGYTRAAIATWDGIEGSEGANECV